MRALAVGTTATLVSQESQDISASGTNRAIRPASQNPRGSVEEDIGDDDDEDEDDVEEENALPTVRDDQAAHRDQRESSEAITADETVPEPPPVPETRNLNQQRNQGHHYVNIQPIPVRNPDNEKAYLKNDLDSLCGVFTSLKVMVRHLLGNSDIPGGVGVVLKMNSAVKRYDNANSSRFHVLSSDTHPLYTWYGAEMKSGIPLSRFTNVRLGIISKGGVDFEIHQYIVNHYEFFGNAMMRDPHLSVIVAALNAARSISNQYSATHDLPPYAHYMHSASTVYALGKFHIKKNIKKQKYIHSTNGVLNGVDVEVFLSNFEEALEDMCRSPDEWVYTYQEFLDSSFLRPSDATDPHKMQEAARKVFGQRVYTITSAGMKPKHTGKTVCPVDLSDQFAVEFFMSNATKKWVEWVKDHFAKHPGFPPGSAKGQRDCVWTMDLACNVIPTEKNTSFVIDARKASSYMKDLLTNNAACKFDSNSFLLLMAGLPFGPNVCLSFTSVSKWALEAHLEGAKEDMLESLRRHTVRTRSEDHWQSVKEEMIAKVEEEIEVYSKSPPILQPLAGPCCFFWKGATH